MKKNTLHRQLSCFAVLVFLFLCGNRTEARQPNLLVVLTDDQGWGDLSIHGNVNLRTPHLDSLAHDGVRFESFYVCQVCAPTRAEFLTGRYHPRTGVSGVSRGEGRLNPDETTIADLFKSAGYSTGAFGKWHNGTQPPLHPNDRGFDQFYGFTSGHWGHYFSPPLDHNRQRVRGNGFVVDDFTDHAIDFMKSHRDEPFFCYVPLNTPHSPMMVEDRFYDRFADVDPKMRHHDEGREDIMMTRAALAMCENIDWNVGRMLACLDELKLAEETIVVFFCDNGPNSYRWNGGMKGRKGSIDEGGLRSPLFVKWPGKIPAGRKIETISGAIDLLPTLTSLAGIRADVPKPLDGVDVSELIKGGADSLPPRSLFAVKRNQVSVRTQKFRLDATGQLFELASDPGQRNNVADQHPDLVKRLREQAADHNREMQAAFAANSDRPFHVGFGPLTTLPARDGVEHGTIRRSAKPPNNSFFTNWTDQDDSISWQIIVGETGRYEATVHYTCAEGDQGCRIRLGTTDGVGVETTVTEVFDPPLYDKSKERVAKSHYFVKDFRPLVLGKIDLPKGRHELRLTAPKVTGKMAIDVHSIDLNRVDD